MKAKKRKKSTRKRGSHTHGRGAMKKARGKGHKGGKGMSGTGKKADQKKTKILNLSKKYFGKSKTLRKKVVKKLQVINLQQISDNPSSFKSEGNTIDLTGYKILSHTSSDLKVKLTIKASAASKKTVEKVKAAGGEITLPTKKPKESKKKNPDSKEKKE